MILRLTSLGVFSSGIYLSVVMQSAKIFDRFPHTSEYIRVSHLVSLVKTNEKKYVFFTYVYIFY